MVRLLERAEARRMGKAVLVISSCGRASHQPLEFGEFMGLLLGTACFFCPKLNC